MEVPPMLLKRMVVVLSLLLILPLVDSQIPPRIGQIRLAGGTGLHEGNIQIEVNGAWGFVCDDGFDFREADLVCQNFGYEDAEKFTRNNHFGTNSPAHLRSTVRFWLSGASCNFFRNGTFRDCVTRNLGNPDCGPTEIAGVVCRTAWSQCKQGQFPCTSSSSACIRRNQVCDTLLNCPDNSDEDPSLCHDVGVMKLLTNTMTNIPGAALGTVYVKHKALWGTVCDDSIGRRDAKVICRSLGYGRGWTLPFPSAYLGEGSGKIWVDKPTCLGTETWVGDCPGILWGETSCAHDEDAGVFCYDGATQLQSASQNSVSKSTVKKRSSVVGVEARLVRPAGSQAKGAGRVELNFGGTWGGVCDTGFDDFDARVFCRMLGYDGDAVAHRRFGKSASQMWGLSFDCLGHESNIQQCRLRILNNACSRNEAAGVTCTQSTGQLDASLKSLLPADCGIPENASNQFLTSLAKVRGGATASRFDSPWLVSLRLREPTGKLVCGGVIISEDYVLTAAHCLNSVGKLNLVVRVGDYNSDVLGDSEEDFYIDKMWTHEAHQEMAFEDNDIALLKIERKGNRGIIFGQQVKPICLPSVADTYRALASCTVSGWGRLFKQGQSASRPREAETQVVPDRQCEEAFGGPRNYTSSMVCVGDPAQRVNPCSGDSGGPLTCVTKGRHTLYGLVSKGFNCDFFRAPDVFTRVTKYLRWIMGKISSRQ